MISFVKLSVGASIVLALAACSSTSDSGDGGTTPTDSGTTDSSVTKDSGSTVQDTGTAQDTGSGDDANTCDFPTTGVTGDATCDSCLQTKCCADILGCFNDKACVTLNNCLADCSKGQSPNDAGSFDAGDTSDGGALQQCEFACGSGASQSVISEFEAANTCLGQTCATECGN